MQQLRRSKPVCGDAFIPPPLWRIRAEENFYDEGIHDFAEAIGVGPGIVVGRLQHERLLARHQGNTLKQKLNWQFA